MFLYAFGNYAWLDNYCWFMHATETLMPCLPMRKMTGKERMNEVVLKGYVKPAGIFIYRKLLENSNYDYVYNVTKERKIPLVIYDEEEGIEIVEV